jgi:uncharacterized membrane protein
MFADGWTCRACWKPNRAQDAVCLRCKTPREADETEVEARRAAAAARAEQPEAVPDIVVALPVVIFRSYARVWLRSGFGLLVLPLLLAFGGVTDIGLLVFTGGFAAGLLATGFLAGEVAEGMRDREVWAFVVGVGLSVVAVVGSILAFQVFAPDLVNPNAIRWVSVIVFGGAGLAAVAGLVMMFTHRDRAT